jgi:transposase-like protein
MGSTRRAFTDEYKAHAVELVVNDGRTIVDVARGIEVHAMALGKWVKKAKDNGPRDRRVRGHRSIEARLGAQHRQVCQAVTAQREHHRQVGDHLGRVMDRRQLAPPRQRDRQLAPQTRRGDRLGQQHPTGLPDRSRRTHVDLDAG